MKKGTVVFEIQCFKTGFTKPESVIRRLLTDSVGVDSDKEEIFTSVTRHALKLQDPLLKEVLNTKNQNGTLEFETTTFPHTEETSYYTITFGQVSKAHYIVNKKGFEFSTQQIQYENGLANALPPQKPENSSNLPPSLTGKFGLIMSPMSSNVLNDFFSNNNPVDFLSEMGLKKTSLAALEKSVDPITREHHSYNSREGSDWFFKMMCHPYSVPVFHVCSGDTRGNKLYYPLLCPQRKILAIHSLKRK